jgi:asparagine synthase (glutamine-hydrolysing)
MSGFIIAARDEGMDLTEIDCRVGDAATAFARKGMIQTYATGHGSSVLYLFRNESHDPARAMSTDNAGRFCTYVGTMLYKGQTGVQATTAILDDVAAGRSGFLESAFGNYSLLIGDKRGMRVHSDPAGLNHIYYSDDLSLVTNSFIAAGCTAPSREFGEQEILEYVLLGAVFGRQSLLAGFELLPARGEIQLNQTGRRVELRDDPWVLAAPSARRVSKDEHIARTIADCDRYFAQVANAFREQVTSALSGGYDSRLVLALLQRHGIASRLFVYGSADDADVRIAKAICRAEGLELQHVDRGAVPALDPPTYWQQQDSVFHGLDGLTQYGFACDPHEISHRRERVSGGLVAVNGGAGEIWRDFWKLPNRHMSARQFVGAVYGGRLAGLYGSGGRPREFLDALSRKVAETTGTDTAELIPPAVIHSLYARFRVRFWQGKNDSVDNHIGYALSPFAENIFAIPAMQIPTSAKRDGLFERQLIQRVAPRLATYDSSYGYDFVSGPGFTERLAIKGKRWTPLWIRRLHRRTGGDIRRTYYQSPEFVRHRFGDGRLEVEKFLRLDRLRDPLAFSRALAVERMLRGQWISE